MHLSNTTTYAISNRGEAILIDFIQQSEDVQDNLERLVPWLKKLQESLTKADPNEDQQGVERRTRLAGLVANRTRHLAWKKRSFVGPWKTSHNDHKPYWRRASAPDFSIRRRMLERSESSSSSLSKQSSSTRWAPRPVGIGHAEHALNRCHNSSR